MKPKMDEFVNNLFNHITSELGIVGWRWEWSSAGGYCWRDQHLIQLLPYIDRGKGLDDMGGDTEQNYAQQLIHEIAHIFIPAMQYPSGGTTYHHASFWAKAEELSLRFLGTGLNRWQVEYAMTSAPEWKPKENNDSDMLLPGGAPGAQA